MGSEAQILSRGAFYGFWGVLKKDDFVVVFQQKMIFRHYHSTDWPNTRLVLDRNSHHSLDTFKYCFVLVFFIRANLRRTDTSRHYSRTKYIFLFFVSWHKYSRTVYKN